MSEKTRKKKQGQNRDKKEQRMREVPTDPRQGADRPDVHRDQEGPDRFDADLKRRT